MQAPFYRANPLKQLVQAPVLALKVLQKSETCSHWPAVLKKNLKEHSRQTLLSMSKVLQPKSLTSAINDLWQVPLTKSKPRKQLVQAPVEASKLLQSSETCWQTPNWLKKNLNEHSVHLFKFLSKNLQPAGGVKVLGSTSQAPSLRMNPGKQVRQAPVLVSKSSQKSDTCSHLPAAFLKNLKEH